MTTQSAANTGVGEGEPDSPEANASLPYGEAVPVAGLRAENAQLCGWAGLAIVNAVFVARLSMPAEGFRVRALHHFYDAAQLLGAGLVVAAAVAVWQRWGPRRAAWGYLAVTAAAIAVGALTLADDLSGPASDLGGEKWSEVWAAALIVAVSLGIPAAALAGRVFSLRPWLRPVGVAAAIGAAVANQRILLNDYQGAHLYLAWAAATLGGASITGARLGRAPRAPASPWPGRLLFAALAAAAAYATLVWPPQSVVVQLGRVQGAVLMPLLAARHEHAGTPAAAIPPDARAWFTDRSKLRPVPPSSPPLLPANAVVVFITIDSLRAEVLESADNLAHLPRIRELMAQSVRFTQARAPGASTRNSLSSVFTGKYRSQLHWAKDKRKGSNLAGDHTVRFTEVLAKAGVPTYTVVSYSALSNGVGIVSGFTEQAMGRRTPGQPFPLSEGMTDQAIERLERVTDGPLFLYLHFMDPHDPYDAAGIKATPYESYVAEVALCDDSIGRIVNTLERERLIDRAVIIISADHGEGFGQHETQHHGLTLYDELVRVPLLVRVPGVPARVVDAPVTLMDVGPTILDLMGLPTPGASMGQSLTPFLRGRDEALTRPIVADSGKMRSMLFGHFIAIQNDIKGSEEIYDLSTDPGETHNLFDSQGAAAGERMAVLQAFFEAHRLKGEKRSREPLDLQ